MDNDDIYETLFTKSSFESKKLLSEYGYFDLNEDEDPIPLFEEILWSLAKKYAFGEINSVVFNSICNYFKGGYVPDNMSYDAQSLVLAGEELDYYTYISPDSIEVLQINNSIKRKLIDRFGPSVESKFKI